jgi:hypothetical protein
VTQIELLSPTNKQGEDYLQYREKRYAALKSDGALVELDFLHETPPVVKGLPLYPTQPDSYPYTITVSDPTPSFEAGTAQTYAFSVDTPLPTVAIPLGEGDQLQVDLNSIYDEVYASLTAYSRRVDYDGLPLRFERYSSADQTRIRQRMATVQEALGAGIDLET